MKLNTVCIEPTQEVINMIHDCARWGISNFDVCRIVEIVTYSKVLLSPNYAEITFYAQQHMIKFLNTLDNNKNSSKLLSPTTFIKDKNNGKID